MIKSDPTFAAKILEKQQTAGNPPSGHLLINAADEIIYANKQARHFLGLLPDETLPAGQKFLSLVRSAYQCYPTFAWLDWPKRLSGSTARYLIYYSPYSTSFSLLKVEIVEHIIVDGNEIWIVDIDHVESSVETAVVRSIVG